MKSISSIKAAAVFSCILLFSIAASAQQPAAAAVACKPAPTMLQLISNPLVTSAIHKRVQAHKVVISPDGASVLSQQYIDGKGKWFVENQRGGADLIEAGVVLKDHAMVAQGLLMFEWAFKRQSKVDGGWPETGDAFHSVSVFIVDVSRSLLAIQESQPEFKELEPRVKAMIPQVDAAAEWLIRPEVIGPGRDHDAPFTHRRWILAAVLGDVGQLANDPKLTAAAVEFAKAGLALQKDDGENPERGGFDVSYQMVDGLQGSRYYTSLNCADNAELMAQIRVMLAKTSQWEMTHLLPDGSVDVAGSTRMLKETGRGGEIKHTNYKEVIQTLTYTSMITGDPQYLAVAKKMAASQGW